MPPKASFGGGAKAVAAAEEEKNAEWEVTPGGMVVQKRDPESVPPAAVVPTIRVKVKHGSAYHEIYVYSQATFGELKKLLSARVEMHPLDQKLIYKDKERDSAAFLDTAGVRDGSKMALVEDPTAKAKRLLEERKAKKMEKAAKSISAISVAVDELASKVSALEAIVNKGGRMVEEDVMRLIELLMNELIKLDGIGAEGDVNLQRRMQVRRVQKYVETLDLIKIKNAMPRANGQVNQQQQFQNLQQHQNPAQYQQQQHKGKLQQAQPQLQLQQQQLRQPLQPAVLTTNWETFDSLFMPSTCTPALTTTATTSTASSTPTTRFDWEHF